MRVLYLLDSLAPGGAETSLAAMAPLYRDLGVELTVAYFWERPGLQRTLKEAGAELVHLGEGTGRAGRARSARALIRGHSPDLVHTTLFEADVAGRIAATGLGVPVVSSLVNEQYGPEHQVAGRAGPVKVKLAQALDAVTAKLATAFHANSQSTATVMGRRLRIPQGRITVIHRGRDAAGLGRRTPERRYSARHALGIAEATRLVLGVGRHEHQKGFDTLLRAVARVPGMEVTVAIAGREGNMTVMLQELTHELGLADRVRFLGHRPDVADLMCAADVLAFPSRYEGLPGTCIEAMALELPIVASDIGPVREVVGEDDPAALLVPADDATQLACALERALTDPKTRERTAKGRERFTAMFTLDRATARMVDWYRTVVGAR